MANPFAQIMANLLPSNWFEKPILSPTNKSLIFSSENKAMSIIGYHEKPHLNEYAAPVGIQIRIIDQHFVLISAKNKINDQIVALRKKIDKKDLLMIFKPTQEEKNRLVMLEAKQKTVPEYEFPYLLIISGRASEIVENETQKLANLTKGKALSFQTLTVAYETAAWDQCKDITRPVGQ